MYDLIYERILAFRYTSVFVLMFVFPTESVMPIVGYAASNGSINVVAAVVVGTLGSSLGAMFFYWLGTLMSRSTVNDFVRKYGKWIGLTVRSTERAGRWFDRNANGSVFVSKFIPAIRSAVSLTAGFRGMAIRPFVGYTLLGTFLSSTLLAVIGYAVRVHFETLAASVTNITGLVSGVFIVVIIAVIAWRAHR